MSEPHKKMACIQCSDPLPHSKPAYRVQVSELKSYPIEVGKMKSVLFCAPCYKAVIGLEL